MSDGLITSAVTLFTVVVLDVTMCTGRLTVDASVDLCVYVLGVTSVNVCSLQTTRSWLCLVLPCRIPHTDTLQM